MRTLLPLLPLPFQLAYFLLHIREPCWPLLRAEGIEGFTGGRPLLLVELGCGQL